MKNGCPYEREENLYDVIALWIQCFDPEELKGFPFNLNYPITKRDSGYTPDKLSFYMDLKDENISVALDELGKINELIKQSRSLCVELPEISIPLGEIAFSNYNKYHGYSRFRCNPYTYKGSISNCPFYLFYTTFDSLESMRPDTTHGEINYYLDGTIRVANAYFWRSCVGYFFEIRNRNGELYIYQIKSTIGAALGEKPPVIYEDEQIIKEREFRKKEHEIYDWIQENLPDLCPKSYSAYRRMKTQNAKNYQRIVAAAHDLGHELENPVPAGAEK